MHRLEDACNQPTFCLQVSVLLPGEGGSSSQFTGSYETMLVCASEPLKDIQLCECRLPPHRAPTRFVCTTCGNHCHKLWDATNNRAYCRMGLTASLYLMAPASGWSCWGAKSSPGEGTRG